MAVIAGGGEGATGVANATVSIVVSAIWSGTSTATLYSNTINNPSGPGYVQPVEFTSETLSQAIPVPDSAGAALVIPDEANTETLSLTGYTGAGLALTVPVLLTFAAGTGRTLDLTSGGAQTIKVIWI